MFVSLKELYRVGPGPSSSHTIGPYRAAEDFLGILKAQRLVPDRFEVTLYGSLALTGRGHLTDHILKKTLGPDITAVTFDVKTKVSHPNTMKIVAFNGEKALLNHTYLSLGGGTIATKGEKPCQEVEVYPFENFSELKKYMIEEGIDFCELVTRFEGKKTLEYLDDIRLKMRNSVQEGLKSSGEVAGELHVKRIASALLAECKKEVDPADRRVLLISAYAYAVAESNAAGSTVVTAPTCGSAGVVAAVLCYLEDIYKISKKAAIEGLIAAGMIGLTIKKNATISGACGGCQAEIGSATAMAAALLCAARGLTLDHIEYAAEVGLEHQLGLTCDPVGGYVAIPCIERNSIAACKAYDAYLFARHLMTHRQAAISFDEVVNVMKETGEDLASAYKETSIGGLAKAHRLG